ncbi:MAG: 16S rRNA (cytosine(1402)-N(4))-methyltransferase RsmH [Acidobacteria bacterium]|nr:16S rRNA (cytosine(1402)-N(4))-methyltransferase RsmH [Acidobacteriota bacterium]
MEQEHIPVLSAEVMEHMAVRPDGHYIDATAGLGGHLGQIAQRLVTGFVIANDRDGESLEMAKKNTLRWAERIRYHQGRFSELRRALETFGLEKVDGLLADLGVSRYQLTDPERGFSLQADGPLDMRTNRTEGTTAGEIVNYTAEKALADLIYQLGEERRARRIARAIVRSRPVRSTLHLARIVESAAPRTGRIHPATQTFMALRIAVNQEVEELEELMKLAPEIVAPGGRIVVLTFMSSEDRVVKQAFQRLAREGRARILTKHVVKPAYEEVLQNPASRSSKLRCLEMLDASREQG